MKKVSLVPGVILKKGKVNITKFEAIQPLENLSTNESIELEVKKLISDISSVRPEKIPILDEAKLLVSRYLSHESTVNFVYEHILDRMKKFEGQNIVLIRLIQFLKKYLVEFPPNVKILLKFYQFCKDQKAKNDLIEPSLSYIKMAIERILQNIEYDENFINPPPLSSSSSIMGSPQQPASSSSSSSSSPSTQKSSSSSPSSAMNPSSSSTPISSSTVSASLRSPTKLMTRAKRSKSVISRFPKQQFFSLLDTNDPETLLELKRFQKQHKRSFRYILFGEFDRKKNFHDSAIPLVPDNPYEHVNEHIEQIWSYLKKKEEELEELENDTHSKKYSDSSSSSLSSHHHHHHYHNNNNNHNMLLKRKSKKKSKKKEEESEEEDSEEEDSDEDSEDEKEICESVLIKIIPPARKTYINSVVVLENMLKENLNPRLLRTFLQLLINIYTAGDAVQIDQMLSFFIEMISTKIENIQLSVFHCLFSLNLLMKKKYICTDIWEKYKKICQYMCYCGMGNELVWKGAYDCFNSFGESTTPIHELGISIVKRFYEMLPNQRTEILHLLVKHYLYSSKRRKSKNGIIRKKSKRRRKRKRKDDDDDDDDDDDEYDDDDDDDDEDGDDDEREGENLNLESLNELGGIEWIIQQYLNHLNRQEHMLACFVIIYDYIFAKLDKRKFEDEEKEKEQQEGTTKKKKKKEEERKRDFLLLKQKLKEGSKFLLKVFVVENSFHQHFYQLFLFFKDTIDFVEYFSKFLFDHFLLETKKENKEQEEGNHQHQHQHSSSFIDSSPPSSSNDISSSSNNNNNNNSSNSSNFIKMKNQLVKIQTCKGLLVPFCEELKRLLMKWNEINDILFIEANEMIQKSCSTTTTATKSNEISSFSIWKHLYFKRERLKEAWKRKEPFIGDEELRKNGECLLFVLLQYGLEHNVKGLEEKCCQEYFYPLCQMGNSLRLKNSFLSILEKLLLMKKNDPKIMMKWANELMDRFLKGLDSNKDDIRNCIRLFWIYYNLIQIKGPQPLQKTKNPWERIWIHQYLLDESKISNLYGLLRSISVMKKKGTQEKRMYSIEDIEEVRVTLLLLLIVKCQRNGNDLKKIGGLQFFKRILQVDKNPAMLYFASTFLLKCYSTLATEKYYSCIRSLIFRAQKKRNNQLLENPFFQIKAIVNFL